MNIISLWRNGEAWASQCCCVINGCATCKAQAAMKIKAQAKCIHLKSEFQHSINISKVSWILIRLLPFCWVSASVVVGQMPESLALKFVSLNHISFFPSFMSPSLITKILCFSEMEIASLYRTPQFLSIQVCVCAHILQPICLKLKSKNCKKCLKSVLVIKMF